MESENKDQHESSRRRQGRGLFGWLFGAFSEEPADTMTPASQPEPWPEQPAEPATPPRAVDERPAVASANGPSAADAVEVLERTIGHFESVIGTLEHNARRAPATTQAVDAAQREFREVVDRFEEALARLTSEAERLSDEASVLAQVSGTLQGRLGELTASFDGAVAERATEPGEAAEPAMAPAEPKFWLGDQPVGLIIAAVPGFQGLMEVQRAMSGLPSVESASVVGYKDGEASLEIALHQPIGAREIVEGLGESTGHRLVIEEARPEELRLRLRFLDQPSGDLPT